MKRGLKMKDITLSLIEIFISLIVETIILGGIFTFISNRTSEKMETKMKEEMKSIESQNKLIYTELTTQADNYKNEIISQIKESATYGNSGLS